MTANLINRSGSSRISTHMPLARHDMVSGILIRAQKISTHMPLARHDILYIETKKTFWISTHMPLARHDCIENDVEEDNIISTHMPLARHDTPPLKSIVKTVISTHMPLARHDSYDIHYQLREADFYSHASCEAWPAPWWKQRNWELFLLTCLLRGMTVNTMVV